MEIPGFEIRQAIGHGGMATVYLAVQKSLDRPVVLKTVNTAREGSATFAERFLNEARIIASLRHPHIITIYDVGKTNGVLYLAMEYVEGGDLQARIQKGLSPDAALDILVPIAGALHFAHQAGIIHRDVKSANILFRRDGTPLLSDFGIAKQLRIDSELTSTGTILGSPFYMSPEQAEGLVLDGRTDIYSLGIIAYEMLTGERPYPGDSAIKVIMQHLQAPVPRVPRRLARFQPLLDRMMCKDREGRFHDAGELVTFLTRLRQQEASAKQVQTTPPGSTPPASTGGYRLAGGYAGAVSPSATVVMRPTHTVALGGQRLWLLLGCLAAVLMGLSGFYAYTQTLRMPEVVRASSPATVAGAQGADGSAPTNTAQPPASSLAHRPGGSHSAALPPTPAPLKADVVKALEWLAQNALRENRLTEPPADNAHYYYSRLLALDPDNRAAREGFHKIAERYVALAERAYESGYYQQAQTYVTLGRQVETHNKGLAALQSMLDNRKKPLLDRLLDFLRGQS